MRRAWPRIEAVSNGIELFLAIDRQVRALGQILTQQAVGVLAGAALPGAMRVAEINAHAGVGRQVGMPCHLLALVVGQALAQRRTDGIELGREARQRRGSSGIFHAREQHQAAGALDQHTDCGLVASALDEVTFLMARHDTILDFRRAHVDADHVGNLATAVSTASAWQARAVAMTQAGNEFAAQFAPGMGVDSGIDGVRGHLELALMREDPPEGSRNLLRRLLPAQHGLHHTPANTLHMQLAAAPGITATGCRPQLRVVRTIRLPGIGVARQLASNGRGRSFKRTGNGPHTKASLSHSGNSDAVLRLKLLIRSLFLHVHTLQDRVLHFTFEAAPIIRLVDVAIVGETVQAGTILLLLSAGTARNRSHKSSR